MIAGHDVIIIGAGLLLMYADIGQYYVIHDRSLAGYLGGWKADLKRLFS